MITGMLKQLKISETKIEYMFIYKFISKKELHAKV